MKKKIKLIKTFSDTYKFNINYNSITFSNIEERMIQEITYVFRKLFNSP